MLLLQSIFRFGYVLTLLGTLVYTTGCESPFNTNVNNSVDALFRPEAELEGFPNTGEAYVILNWSLPGVDDFRSLEIWYRNIVPDTVKPEDWQLATTITSAHTTEYRHMVFDDEDILYQFSVQTINGVLSVSEVIAYLPRTTRLIVPPGDGLLREFYRSPLMDPGDSLSLEIGVHHVFELNASQKQVSFIGAGLPSQVIVKQPPPILPPDDTVKPPGNAYPRFLLRVGSCTIANITFLGVLLISNSTIVKNCIADKTCNTSNIGQCDDYL